MTDALTDSLSYCCFDLLTNTQSDPFSTFVFWLVDQTDYDAELSIFNLVVLTCGSVRLRQEVVSFVPLLFRCVGQDRCGVHSSACHDRNGHGGGQDPWSQTARGHRTQHPR